MGELGVKHDICKVVQDSDNTGHAVDGVRAVVGAADF